MMAKTTRKKTTRKKSVARRSTRARTVETDCEEAVAAHRLRQASVAAVLDQVFGPFGASDPKLWERRAYLLLVGSVYERLATDPELGTDELVKLARVLAEIRRAKPPGRSSTSRGAVRETSGSCDGNGRLPDRFADMVRDLYGTQLDSEPEKAKDRFEERRGGVGG